MAVTLLKLRDMSRMKNARETMASEVLDCDYIAVLSLWRFSRVKKLTVHDFFTLWRGSAVTRIAVQITP